MKKWVMIVIVVALVIFGLFWAWSRYSISRSMTVGGLTAPAPARNAPAAPGANQ